MTTTNSAIPALVYADIEAAHDFLVTAFGLTSGGTVRDDAGNTVHGEVTAGDQRIWLHAVARDHGMDTPRALGAATGQLIVLVDDVDTHHEQTRAAGARIVYPPADMPYGQREYGVLDSEDRLWSFATPT